MGQGLVRLTFVALVFLVTLASGCAPGAPAPTSGAGPAQPRAPITLTIGVQNGPTSFMSVPYGGSPSQGGTQHDRYVGHDFLVVQDEVGAWIPHLAVEKPSLEKGTWVVNPDGTMDVTWQIRPNVTWHDGTPFTSDDLLFTLGVKTDPEMRWPTSNERLVRSGSAPDPLTFIIHWRSTYNRA